MSSTRLLGRYLNVATITPSGGSVVDIKSLITNLTLTVEKEQDNVSAVSDWWDYPFDISARWRMDIDLMDEPDTAGGSKLRTLIDAALNNTQVAVVISHAPPSGTAKYNKWTGNGILSFNHTFPKGSAIVSLSITGQGALTRTAHDA